MSEPWGDVGRADARKKWQEIIRIADCVSPSAVLWGWYKLKWKL